METTPVGVLCSPDTFEMKLRGEDRAGTRKESCQIGNAFKIEKFHCIRKKKKCFFYFGMKSLMLLTKYLRRTYQFFDKERFLETIFFGRINMTVFNLQAHC